MLERGKLTTQDHHEILTKLGLTKVQAEVYLTLTKLHEAPIKVISATAKIDRAHVYQVMRGLQEKGLVQKILATPNRFKAISLQEGMKILLERKAKEFTEIEEKAIKAVQSMQQNKNEDDLQNSEDQFVLIPGKETHNREFIKLFKNTQINYDGIFSRQDDFCWYMLKEHEDGKDGVTRMLLHKGVKIRLIVCNPENKNLPRAVLKTFRDLSKIGDLKIKFAVSCTAPMFGIIDNKAIFRNTGSAHEWMEKPSLYSTNRRLVEIAQGYFENMWQISVEKDL